MSSNDLRRRTVLAFPLRTEGGDEETSVIRDTSTMDRVVERPTRSRRLVLVAIVVAVVAVVALALPAARRWMSSERTVDASQLRFGTVTRGDLVREVEVEGNVVAAFRPTLTSPARGTARVEVQAGQTVAKGQVLVRVESPEADNKLEQQRSAMLAAEADLERQRILARQSAERRQQEVELLQVQLDAAKRAMARAQKTRDEGLLNAVDYEKAQDDVKVTAMRLEAAQKDAALDGETTTFDVRNKGAEVDRQRLLVADLQRQVDELQVRSPVAGLVSKVAVEDRDSVTQGQPLVGVVDLSQLQVEVFVPESYAPDIRPGTPAVISIDGADWRGELQSLSPEVEGSRVRGVVAFSGKTPPGLKQSQRLSARLILETRHGVLKVPRGPFFEALGGRQAYVVDDDVAVKTPIQVGAVSVTELEIQSGLREGQQIVLSDPTPFGGADRVMLQK